MKNKPRNKGSAFGLIIMGLLFMVVLYVAFGSIGAIYSANTNGCVVFNGSLTNCSQSDYAYNAINQTNSAANTVFGLSEYFPLIFVVLGILFLIVGYVKMR